MVIISSSHHQNAYWWAAAAGGTSSDWSFHFLGKCTVSTLDTAAGSALKLQLQPLDEKLYNKGGTCFLGIQLTERVNAFLIFCKYFSKTSTLWHVSKWGQCAHTYTLCKLDKGGTTWCVISPQEVLMTSRSSAYFHLLRSYFFPPAAALVACTWGPLQQGTDEHEREKKECTSVTECISAGSGISG